MRSFFLGPVILWSWLFGYLTVTAAALLLLCGCRGRSSARGRLGLLGSLALAGTGRTVTLGAITHTGSSTASRVSVGRHIE
ncbi:hypothetical protein CLU79DRAFT_759335 [Phycomyces nitens]|nr:hypothetical protein CLU79DRAFT_759335 [Phycomyces nitens]